jgi:ABC-type lipoprotein release transport system permease subunit
MTSLTVFSRRNKMVRWIWLFVVVGCLCGCTSEGVMIRISNNSEVELRDVVVKFPQWQMEKYDTIASNSTTEYRKVKRAYGYAYIQAVVDGKEAVLQPEDYVGEKFLEPGKYAYVLTYDPAATDKYVRLGFKLVKE